MDETTPHLHLNLIPIADGRLCAKQLFDRKALQGLQTEFYTVVGKKWNLQRGKELKNTDGISDADLKSLARTLFPALREYLSSEQGQKDYAEWKRSQLNNSI